MRLGRGGGSSSQLGSDAMRDKGEVRCEGCMRVGGVGLEDSNQTCCDINTAAIWWRKIRYDYTEGAESGETAAAEAISSCLEVNQHSGGVSSERNAEAVIIPRGREAEVHSKRRGAFKIRPR